MPPPRKPQATIAALPAPTQSLNVSNAAAQRRQALDAARGSATEKLEEIAEPFKPLYNRMESNFTRKLVVCMNIIASRTGSFQALYEAAAIPELDKLFLDPKLPKPILHGTDYAAIFDLLTTVSFLQMPVISAFHSVIITIDHTRRTMERTHIPFWELLEGIHLINFTKWVAGHLLTSLQLANGWQTRWQCTMATAEETNVALRHFQYWEGPVKTGHLVLPLGSHGTWL